MIDYFLPSGPLGPDKTRRKSMTLKDDILKNLRADTNDPEGEHSDEDDALWDFVRAVYARAEVGSELKETAYAMLAWDEANAERTRWCA